MLECHRKLGYTLGTSKVAVYARGTINEDYQRYLTETTHDEFTIRNIFYGANVIERVYTRMS